MKIAICGSMAFAKEMFEIKSRLNLSHNTTPANVEKYADGRVSVEDKWEKIESDVIKSYFEEIKKVDAILVVNKDKNNIKNYVGGNALIEMAFAHILNKKIFLLNGIPKMSYSDELGVMKPVVLNGDLSRIK
ncbi:MAG: hypothetical protein AABW88_02725 [Nanoarchaeota archaeon]